MAAPGYVPTKYGLSSVDSANGQITYYKSILLPYSPLTGYSDIPPVNNCILWVDLGSIRWTRPTDSIEFDTEDTFVSKLSSRTDSSGGVAQVNLPMFIYNQANRDSILYAKSTRSITLPKGSGYSLRTPPITIGQVGGGTRAEAIEPSPVEQEGGAPSAAAAASGPAPTGPPPGPSEAAFRTYFTALLQRGLGPYYDENSRRVFLQAEIKQYINNTLFQGFLEVFAAVRKYSRENNQTPGYKVFTNN